jgi:hypothetical protein
MRGMARLSMPLILAATIATTSCATSTPTGPSVMVLPGTGKSFEQFQADDVHCRQAAATSTEATKEGNVHPQQRYDMAYMQCMYAVGNQVPMAGRPPTPGVPPPPAGTPPAPPPSSAPPPSPTR